MIDSIFSDDVPRAVLRLQNDLRILLDRRGENAKRKSSGNVIEFVKPVLKSDEALLVEAYQELAAETAEFFYKEDLSLEDYRKFRKNIKKIHQQALGVESNG